MNKQPESIQNKYLSRTNKNILEKMEKFYKKYRNSISILFSTENLLDINNINDFDYYIYINQKEISIKNKNIYCYINNSLFQNIDKYCFIWIYNNNNCERKYILSISVIGKSETNYFKKKKKKKNTQEILIYRQTIQQFIVD